MDAADPQQEEHRRRVGRADDGAEQEATAARESRSTSRAATPTSAVVSTTPSVASTIAGSAAWRKAESRVPKPESKRMMASATLPRK